MENNEYLIKEKMLPIRVAFFLVLIFFCLIIKSWYFYVFAAIAMALSFFYDRGVEIDKKGARVRIFSSFLFYRSGKWRSMTYSKCIAIGKSQRGLLIYGANTNASVENKKTYYNVFLSSLDFKQRFKVWSSTKLEESEKYANELGLFLNFPVLKMK